MAKMRACGHPDKLGDRAERCLPGGQGTHLVAMRGQSSLGGRGAKVPVDPWVSQGSTVLQEGGIYRHSILTVPAMFPMPCSPNAAGGFHALRRCGAQGLDDFSSTVQGKALTGGDRTVLHTHGRHGQDPPHVPGLAPTGGEDAQGACGEPLPSLPSARLRRKWQGPLRTMRRQTRTTEASDQVVDPCVRPSPAGLVTNGPKGTVPAQAHRVARSVAQDVGSPPLAGRRIDRSAGAWGT